MDGLRHRGRSMSSRPRAGTRARPRPRTGTRIQTKAAEVKLMSSPGCRSIGASIGNGAVQSAKGPPSLGGNLIFASSAIGGTGPHHGTTPTNVGASGRARRALGRAQQGSVLQHQGAKWGYSSQQLLLAQEGPPSNKEASTSASAARKRAASPSQVHDHLSPATSHQSLYITSAPENILLQHCASLRYLCVPRAPAHSSRHLEATDPLLR